ncbi:hypothetical protein FACS1894181_15670 [Bacteroidia bacterium]|nr:hypothetical protein FACS1894181_15670 [Bacteroidia bacterium]
MKQLIITIVLLAGTLQGIRAQEIEIRGLVRNAKDKEAVEFINIVLQTEDSVFVAGTVTDGKGQFILAGKPGNYLLAVSGLGYEKKYLPLKEAKGNLTLPDILLEEAAIALKDVTVSASNLTSTIDKKLVYPSERQVKASTNGIDLLQQLMLPKLLIDPLNNTAKLPGGGEVQYRINGVKVESQDIVALIPADIIRVEYHDNPGLRYGNAEVVLDYIVRRPETGGSIGLNLQDAFTAAWGNNYFNGRLNHKKSEFSFNYGISHRDFYKMWRDNEESFTLADGSTLQRREIGRPGHGQMSWQNINGAYSFQHDKRMLNVALRTYASSKPHMDYYGTLYNTADPSDKVEMVDRSSGSSLRPALDLYYQENLANGQTLVANLVGTYNYTDEKRIYTESRDELLLTDVNNSVIGKKYSLIGEGIYEKKMGANSLSAGMKHTQVYADNEYRNGHNYTSEMTQAETVVYADFKGKVKKFSHSLAAGLMRSYVAQSGSDDYSSYTPQARLVVQYALPGRSSIRILTGTGITMPSLADISAVDQTVDSLQIRRGNPGLKPYFRFRNELTYEIQKGIFYGNLWATYVYLPKAIMDEKFLEGGKIIQTWNNQKNWQQLASRLNLRAGPIRDIFQISAEGGVNHYISNGNTYRHTYTNLYTNIYLSATYKNFSANTGLETNYNRFYGETMDGGENIHYVMLGYKLKDLSLSAGMFNPFSDNYKQQSENRSEHASYKRSNYINETSRLITLRLTWNFSFGRKFNDIQKRLNNADNDSGVMSTGK